MKNNLFLNLISKLDILDKNSHQHENVLKIPLLLQQHKHQQENKKNFFLSFSTHKISSLHFL